ncbi:hypothetical protein GGH97_003451 [Coemansia sp. RSA 475]|nr:hypothetical protein GGH97_003451 [Coemansia sp. RSA 475]
MEASTVRVGWIGLGTMGLEMARNLQQHRARTGQTPITVYNRTHAKCALVAEHGAHVAVSPASIAQTCTVVFLSLRDDQAVKDIVTQLLDSIALETRDEPLLIADLTTVHPSTTQWVLHKISQANTKVRFCQTPVWGAPPAARSANLVYVTSGSNSDSALLAEISVPAFAHTTIACDDPVRAAKFKIMGNFMIAGILETLGEAMAVAHESGISRELYLEFVKAMFPVAPILGYAHKMVDEDGEASKTQVGFNIHGGMKDVGYAIDVAKSAGLDLPVAELAHKHLQWVLDNGDENWDWSSLAFALRKQ